MFVYGYIKFSTFVKVKPICKILDFLGIGDYVYLELGHQIYCEPFRINEFGTPCILIGNSWYKVTDVTIINTGSYVYKWKFIDPKNEEKYFPKIVEYKLIN